MSPHRCQDISNEFHLTEGGANGWELTQIHSTVLRYEERERQPGEPSFQAFVFENAEAEQPLRFVLTSVGAASDDITIGLDGRRSVALGQRLADGESLVYEGDDRATHYSGEWQVLGAVPMDAAALQVAPGRHELTLEADIEGGGEAHLKMELRLRGDPELVPRPR